FEGAQGAMLDIDHGTYPYVTSSNTVSGGICTGTGVGPRHLDAIVGVVKAYCTRVGNGPFPTELDNELGQAIRTRGIEVGATTGRPRRCGWLDLVALRYAIRVNSLTALCMTKLDILDEFDTVRVCTHYRLGDKLLDDLPSDPVDFAACEPVYRDFAGWQANTASARTWDALPEKAQEYLKSVQELAGIPIVWVSTSAERDDMIVLDPVIE
ncbi:MAG: adenylosuccinate synthetase, partial [Pseudomonadota bacterium]